MFPYWKFRIAEGAASEPFRKPRMALLNVRLRLQRGFYRMRYRRDTRRFNVHERAEAASVDRAEIAAGLIETALSNPTGAGLTVADIGCGDGKLGRIPRQRGAAVEYRGYDIVPQFDDFIRHDVNKDILPDRADVAVSLGVLEHSQSGKERPPTTGRPSALVSGARAAPGPDVLADPP